MPNQLSKKKCLQEIHRFKRMNMVKELICYIRTTCKILLTIIKEEGLHLSTEELLLANPFTKLDFLLVTIFNLHPILHLTPIKVLHRHSIESALQFTEAEPMV